MLKVLIDMDGVITDILSVWCDTYNLEYNDQLTVCQFAATWNVHAHVNCGHRVYDIINRPGFFDALPLFRDAYEGLYNIKEMSVQGNIRPIIVSDCGGISNRASGKLIWLQTYAPWIIKDTIFCNDKSLIPGDVLIDDRFSVLSEWKLAHPAGYAMLMTAPHNIDVNTLQHGMERVHSWNDIIDQLYFIVATEDYRATQQYIVEPAESDQILYDLSDAEVDAVYGACDVHNG